MVSTRLTLRLTLQIPPSPRSLFTPVSQCIVTGSRTAGSVAAPQSSKRPLKIWAFTAAIPQPQHFTTTSLVPIHFRLLTSIPPISPTMPTFSSIQPDSTDAGAGC